MVILERERERERERESKSMVILERERERDHGYFREREREREREGERAWLFFSPSLTLFLIPSLQGVILVFLYPSLPFQSTIYSTQTTHASSVVLLLAASIYWTWCSIGWSGHT